ncbi:hypothetical protein ACFL6P_02015 [Candidatus Latescibacterota bacterium]
MKTTNEIEEICKKLKPIIGEKADTLWYLYLAEDENNRKKLALDIEIMLGNSSKRILSQIMKYYLLLLLLLMLPVHL